MGIRWKVGTLPLRDHDSRSLTGSINANGKLNDKPDKIFFTILLHQKKTTKDSFERKRSVMKTPRHDSQEMNKTWKIGTLIKLTSNIKQHKQRDAGIALLQVCTMHFGKYSLYEYGHDSGNNKCLASCSFAFVQWLFFEHNTLSCVTMRKYQSVSLSRSVPRPPSIPITSTPRSVTASPTDHDVGKQAITGNRSSPCVFQGQLAEQRSDSEDRASIRSRLSASTALCQPQAGQSRASRPLCCARNFPVFAECWFSSFSDIHFPD